MTRARAFLAAAVAAMMPLAASAAELPAAFLGTWRVANPTDSRCRAADVKGSAEGHIVVRPGEVTYYESECQVVSVRPTRHSIEREPVSVAADLACSGEGMRWRTRSLWHLETVDGKRLIAVTTLGQSRPRDPRVRRIAAPVLPMTTLYAACR